MPASESSDSEHWLQLLLLRQTSTTESYAERTGNFAVLCVMTGGSGIVIAVIAITMADTAVTVPYVLPTPMDMATGMEAGITVLLDSICILDCKRSGR